MASINEKKDAAAAARNPRRNNGSTPAMADNRVKDYGLNVYKRGVKMGVDDSQDLKKTPNAKVARDRNKKFGSFFFDGNTAENPYNAKGDEAYLLNLSRKRRVKKAALEASKKNAKRY
jgi:hypothetical protein